MSWSLKLIASLAVFSAVLAGCKKDDKVETPPAQAHFLNRTSGTYFVTGPNTSYKIPIGTTTVSNEARKVTVAITSPTGAVQGTQYILPSNTVTIPAGKAVDSLVIQGIYSQYPLGGRRDTLIITIQDQDVKKSDYNNTFKLLVRPACNEADDIIMDDLLGDYDNTNEDLGGSPYGPYTTSITAVNQLTATTGTITVENIFDAGWNPLVFTLDWTDPNNKKVTLVEQMTGTDASTVFGPTYSGKALKVGPVPVAAGGTVGTFSACSQRLTLNMWIGIQGVGYYPALYSVSMVR